MYTGNREYFALKRQLIDEAKEKLNSIPGTQSEKDAAFVYEWCDNGDSILGFGCNSLGDVCCLRPKIVPGLFVISSDTCMLKHICALYGYQIEPYELEYDTNNFAVWDLLQDYSVCKPGNLVKIITHTVSNAQQLYNKFKYNHQSYKFAGVPQYFNVCTQIMFELLIIKNLKLRKAKLPLDYTVPETTMMWLDENLNIYDREAPKIPIITFDIETVSSDPHRVPMGDARDDILFTVSIHHTHTNILYTLVYLPLKMHPKDMALMIKDDGYDIIPDKSVDDSKCINVLECFGTERDLLTRTMELLNLKSKLHFLFGYNSINYDIKYLLMRCSFYGIHMDKFIWREGYSFGVEQIHLDMFRITVMRYRLKSYTLNDVSREILKNSKTGVSAVNLRYTFFRMVKYGRFFKHSEGSEKMPSVKDTLEYNNADTLLVSKLEKVTKSIAFIIKRAQDCNVPLTTMNTNFNKMQYKLWNECFIIGLKLKIYLATFKQPNASIKCITPSPYSQNDITEIDICLTDKLNVIDASENVSSASSRYTVTPQKKAKFPGGANFCLGERNADNVQMYDYVTAYPVLMDRKNISDETTTVLAASVLLMLYPNIKNHHTFKTYDYMAHSGTTKTETVVLYYQYIYDKLYCGGEFPFTADELKSRGDSPVIIIWEGRRGVLSRIISYFSQVRADTKLYRKALDELYANLIDKKNELAAQKFLMESLLNQTEPDIIDADVESCSSVGKHKAQESMDDMPDTKRSKDSNHDDDEIFGFETDEDDDATAAAVNSETLRNDDEVFGFESEDEANNDIEQENKIDNRENDEVFGFESETDDDDRNVVQENNDDEVFGFESEDETEIGETNTKDEKLIENVPTDGATSNSNKFITYYGHVGVLNEAELMKENDPLQIISELAESVALERNNVSNSYDLQKSIVSSIYGCVGKMIVVVAAVITSMTRSTLLASAQYCRSLGYEVLYIDTDSIMIVGCNEDLSGELNRLYPFMEMEMKVARKCMFVKRKTYYKVEDGFLKYGQNVNGPNSWRECVEYFYNKNTIQTNEDIYQAFYDFFKSIYEKLLKFESITPEFLNCITQTIKTKDEYKTMTVTKKFLMYLSDKYPALAGSHKHSVFYFLDNSVLIPCLRPELDITSVDFIRYVNLFKYYQNMYTTIFNLIKFHVKKNNEPHNITLSSKYVLLLMLKGFLDAYEATFLVPVCDDKVVEPITLDSDAEMVFDNPIYTEVFGEAEE